MKSKSKVLKNALNRTINLLNIKYFLFFLLILNILFFQISIAFAIPPSDFTQYQDEWSKNKVLASKYLEEASKAFKEGDELSGCVAQQKAGMFGIKATESLIKAKEINNNKEEIIDLKRGLEKWKELRDSC